jgi:4-alpha-glucanotransferase
MDELEKRLLKSITGKQWEKIGVRHHHGINLPLFSLRSENSSGIGEFLDLLPLIDWCQTLKIDFIQLLPLNNLNAESDSSPYNAVSSCALNFLYLSLHALPFLEELPELKSKLAEFKKFNATTQISYTEIVAHKKSWLDVYVNHVEPRILESQEFQSFYNSQPWLKPYALFKALKDQLKNISWTSWPEELRYPTPEKIDHLHSLYPKEVSFYLLAEYLCFTQLKAVKTYAEKKGIFLMGDIPILVSRESADVWYNPELFDVHLQAGAPPDSYNEVGQNWGFPIFNWDALRKTHFEWWKQRLHYAQTFFDLVRLDHILGFFRIWAIPPQHLAEDGHYTPEEETEWESQGKELLTMLASSTTMLPIGEDLGCAPDIVRPCLNEMGICGTKVMRWEKAEEVEGKETEESYVPIEDHPPVSITCTSTHDSSEATAFAKSKQWTYTALLSAEQRQQILWESHHSASLFHVNLLQEYLALFPELIWQDPESERINIPGTILPTNWTYRFRPSVEELTSHKGLFSKMNQIISN